MNEEILKDLTPEEKDEVLKILQDFSTSGHSDKFNSLVYEDYKEIPVTIDKFLDDDIYLGKGLNMPDEDGKTTTIFPYWRETLRKLFPTNIDTAYNTLILTGGIGLGKSLIAVVCVLYELYRMLCLKDPCKHYGIQEIDKITFSLLNISIEAARGVAWNKLQQLLQASPWFLEHGKLSQSLIPEWSPKGNIELIYGSLPRHIIGRNLFCSFEDEISFLPNQDVEKQKEKAKALISSADVRMQSRFMKGEKNPTLHIIASSKRTEQSFLETYIATKKKNDSKTTLIVDEPQWVIRNDKISNRWFKVAVGNKFLENELIPLNASEEDLKFFRDRGYSILNVPFGYYEQFLDDLNKSLTDIAGISTSSTSNYISGARWAKCKKEDISNPFTKEVIKVGNGMEDKAQYSDFFDLTKVPKKYKNKPLFIHLDMSLSGDKTGIAGVWIIGKRPHQEGVPDSKELYYRLAFSVAIEAPKGYQVSFEKNRQFIYWLKENDFNIKGISFDTFQSADLSQQLIAHGFKCDTISVDRLTGEGKSKVCQPYLIFRNTINEERIITYPTILLTDEIIGLVRDGNGKIDHSPNGVNSKDISDAVCGSLYNASLHAEEYAFDYGEDMDTFINSNKSDDSVTQEQLVIDMENELNKIHDPLGKYRQQNKSPSEEDEEEIFVGDGMIVW